MEHVLHVVVGGGHEVGVARAYRAFTARRALSPRSVNVTKPARSEHGVAEVRVDEFLELEAAELTFRHPLALVAPVKHAA